MELCSVWSGTKGKGFKMTPQFVIGDAGRDGDVIEKMSSILGMLSLRQL